jgi:hypothetical protein
VRAFTDEQLADLLRRERARVVHAVLEEVDAFQVSVRKTDAGLLHRLHERIVGLLAVMDSPTGDDSDGRRQTGGQGSERPHRGQAEHGSTGRGKGVEATVVREQRGEGLDRGRGLGESGNVRWRQWEGEPRERRDEIGERRLETEFAERLQAGGAQ